MRGPIGDLRDFSCHLRLWFTFFSVLLLEGIFSLCATELCTSDLHVEFVCAQMTSLIETIDNPHQMNGILSCFIACAHHQTTSLTFSLFWVGRVMQNAKLHIFG